MINFSTDLIKRFLEETCYMDLDNKKIQIMRIDNEKIYCDISYKHDNISEWKAYDISMLEIMGWFLNKIELKNK